MEAAIEVDTIDLIIQGILGIHELPKGEQLLAWTKSRAPSQEPVGLCHQPGLWKDHHAWLRQEERQEVWWPLHKKLLNVHMKVLGGGEL